MSESLARLFPGPPQQVRLEGLYLGEIPDAGSDRPFVYANFVSSLDGRIGLPRKDSDSSGVPPDIANARDWRLYQELAAQADVLITSARYFRQAALGQAQDNLPLGPEAAFDDLRRWRAARGLTAQPAVCILSASLDIPLAALDGYQARGIHVFTTDQADNRRIRELKRAGAEVHVDGRGPRVDGRSLVSTLSTLGFHNQYAIGGPDILYTLASAGVLNRLYLTFSFRVLAGDVFDTIIRGPALDPSPACTLQGLYLDTPVADGGGQLFTIFDTAPHHDAGGGA